MELYLDQWVECLERAANRETGSRSWICEVVNKQGVRTLAALSSEEPNSRRLSFKEIVYISQELMTVERKFNGSKFRAPRKMAVRTDVAQAMQTMNLFSVNAAREVQDQLKGVKEICDLSGRVCSSLEKIAQRSKTRREEEKVSSLWGRIKWYIWSIFFDKSSAVNKVKDSSPLFAGCFNAEMKDRMYVNISSFEEEIGLPEAERSKEGQYDTPAKVKKYWLTRFSEDKYPQEVSQRADENRKRIVAMLKIWTEVIRFEDSDKVPETPKDTANDSKLIGS